MINLEATFEKYRDSCIVGWKDVHPRRSQRADLHVFLLLDSLVPRNRSILAGAEHDKIYLDADTEKLAKVITEEQVLELTRCGVFFEDDSLCMFV